MPLSFSLSFVKSLPSLSLCDRRRSHSFSTTRGTPIVNSLSLFCREKFRLKFTFFCRVRPAAAVIVNSPFPPPQSAHLRPPGQRRHSRFNLSSSSLPIFLPFPSPPFCSVSLYFCRGHERFLSGTQVIERCLLHWNLKSSS